MTNPLEQLPTMVLYARDPKTNRNVEVLVDGDYDGEWFSGFKWSINPLGYVVASPHGDYKGTWIYLHRLVGNPPGNLWCFFRNGNKRDCRSRNIDWVTPRESAMRRPSPKYNRISTSGYRGVSKQASTTYNAAGKKVYAISKSRYTANFKGRYLGSGTAEECARLYDNAARKAGFTHNLNFPEEGKDG